MALELAGAGLLAGGSLLGNIIAGDKAADAAKAGTRAMQDAQRRAAAIIGGYDIPELEELIYTPEEYQYLGDYTPEMEQEILLGSSAMEDISGDPRLRAAQMKALEQMSGYAEGGLTEADLAALQQVRRGAAGEAQAKQAQIMDAMASRGTGGSGAELIARLQAGQAAADRQAVEGLEVARMAQQRALQALSGQEQMARGIRSQDFGESSDVARARDIVNQFNTQQQIGREQRSVGERNRALASNLAREEQTYRANVDQRNLAKGQKSDAIKWRAGQDLAKRSGQAGQSTQMGQTQMSAAQAEAARQAAQGQTVGNILTSLIPAVSGPSAVDQAKANYYNSMASSGGAGIKLPNDYDPYGA